jgi:hypothetical protein
MLPTILFILHVEPADGGSHSRKNLAFSHLPTRVHVCDWIRTGTPFPVGKYALEYLSWGNCRKVCRDSSPCLKAGVSLR